MKYLRRLHDRVAPPGLETAILKKLPGLAIAATVVPLLVALGGRLLADGSDAAIQKQLMSIDIFCVAIAITAWISILTVSIGCVFVYIMKGPGYVADSYEVPHTDHPLSSIEKQ